MFTKNGCKLNNTLPCASRLINVVFGVVLPSRRKRSTKVEINSIYVPETENREKKKFSQYSRRQLQMH
jgi:hypothetical protein